MEIFHEIEQIFAWLTIGVTTFFERNDQSSLSSTIANGIPNLQMFCHHGIETAISFFSEELKE
jgi:hypothetical protein